MAQQNRRDKTVTELERCVAIFAYWLKKAMLANFHILTVSHKEVAIDELPKFAMQVSDSDSVLQQLSKLKTEQRFSEIYYLSTCNRILYLFVTDHSIDEEVKARVFNNAQDVSKILHLQGGEALVHLFQVASSIHSLVVGEREILKQIRDAYDEQFTARLTGDQIRLAIQHTIRTAKQVYANTKIGERPVSVVSLAVQKLLKSFDLPKDAQFLVVGAGTTIQLLLKHLTKKGFRNFSIYNRSPDKARVLMQGLIGQHGDLTQLLDHEEPFDCVIACTGSQKPIISLDLARKISGNQVAQKIWLDLGIPPDVDDIIQSKYSDRFIGVHSLQELSKNNLQLRLEEAQKADLIFHEALESFEKILYQRKVEKAFRLIPDEIKSVREKAVQEVFRKDLDALDDQTQDLVIRMLEYMEKKCISIPMKAAKEVAI